VASFNRATLTQVHLLLATFMFPVALMFLVTGGLYTWDIKGDYASQAHTVALDSPLVADAGQLKALAERELQRLGVAVPSGGFGVKKAGTSFQLEWTGVERDVVLEPTTDALNARLVIKDTGWHRHFVQLHKAKGASPFKIYAAFLAVALFVILLSGFLLAWQVPKYRRLAAGCALAGFATFVVLAAVS
jgi:hypothetical protein